MASCCPVRQLTSGYMCSLILRIKALISIHVCSPSCCVGSKHTLMHVDPRSSGNAHVDASPPPFLAFHGTRQAGHTPSGASLFAPWQLYGVAHAATNMRGDYFSVGFIRCLTHGHVAHQTSCSFFCSTETGIEGRCWSTEWLNSLSHSCGCLHCD